MCLPVPLLFIFLHCINLINSTYKESINNNVLEDNELFSSEIITHAFVQTGSELHYFKDISQQENLLVLTNTDEKDSILFRVSEEHLDYSHHSPKKSNKNVQLFDSDTTHFGRTPVGVPVRRRIPLTNPTNSELLFSTVFSTSLSFHCSFPEQKSLAPKKQSSIFLYYLPAAQDKHIENEYITLQTQIGRSSQRIRGENVGNPYRISYFSDIRIPLNASFFTPISLHNPHSSPIQVIDVFSSDNNIHLDLVESNEGKRFNFEPYETKDLTTVSIIGNIERNSTAFIFIKFRILNEYFYAKDKLIFEKEKRQNFHEIIIPLEFEVTRRRGLFSTVNSLDFGLNKIGEPIMPQKLNVFSTLERGVDIESIYAQKGNGIYLQFESRPPISVKCGARSQPGAPVPIATVNIDANSPEKNNEISDSGAKFSVENANIIIRKGIIITESRGGNYNVTVPFRSVLYKGNLLPNSADLAFYNAIKPNLYRQIALTNTFPFGLAIWAVSLADNAKNSFEVLLVSPVVYISSGQTMFAFIIRYFEQKTTIFSSFITLYTNLSTFQLPLLIYHGHLKVSIHSLEKEIFNFGNLKYSDSRSISFTISNPNPLQLRLTFDLPLNFRDIILLSIIGTKFNRKDQISLLDGWKSVRKRLNSNNYKSINLFLPAHSSIIFNLTLCSTSRTKSTEKRLGFLRIRTQFYKYKFPIHYQRTNFALVSLPGIIAFNDAFIGSFSTEKLILLHNFTHNIRILRLTIPNGDSRFRLHSKFSLDIIRPNQPTNVANISLIAEALCKTDCYLGIPLNTGDGQWFTYGMKLPHNLAEIDHYLYNRLKQKWIEIKKAVVHAKLNVETDQFKGYEVPIEAHLSWPRLLSHSVVHFPLTAVGNFSIVNLTITNPSRFPIIVQVLPMVVYPDVESLIELFHDELPAPLINPININETLMFSLRDTELFTLRPGSPVPQLREEVERVVGSSIPRFTLSLLLPPRISMRVRIGFLPTDYSLRTSLLLIRNNLTAFETIVLYGRGARMHMEIDNKTARSSPLLFELQPQHLSDCTNPRRQLHKLHSTLTVRRSFSIKNNGEVSFNIVNISINGMPCENRGFKVLNCDRFRLEPNDTTYLDIAFTPDFLFSVNDASLQLYMHMNGTPWVFDLSANIPWHLLGVCHSALPRPPFEALMYHTCVLALIFCFICVISCAYLEGDRVVMCAYKQQFAHEQEIFDLNSPNLLLLDIGSEFLKNVKIGSKREFIPIAANAGPFGRSFWRTFNFILWLFSYVWPLIRSNNYESTKKKGKQQRQSVHCFYFNEPANNQAYGTEMQSKFTMNVDSEIYAQKMDQNLDQWIRKTLNPFEETKCSNSTTERDEGITSFSTSDECKHDRSKIKVQRKKKKRTHERSNIDCLPGDLKKSKKNAQGNLFKTQTEVNSTFSDADEREAMYFHQTQRSSLYKTQASEKRNKTETTNAAKKHDHSNSSDGEWPKQRDKENSGNNEIETIEKLEGFNFDDGNEENRSSDEKESDVPEWADEPVEELKKGRTDEDFGKLVERSATLFAQRSDNSYSTSPSLSASVASITSTSDYTNKSNGIIGPEKDGEADGYQSCSKIRSEKTKEDEHIDRIIDRWTLEFRETLTKILKNGLAIGIGKSKGLNFQLPADLSANYAKYASASDSNNQKTQEVGEQQLNLQFNLESLSKWQIDTEGKKSIKSHEKSVFLFDDPIWKPLGEFDNESSSNWPTFGK